MPASRSKKADEEHAIGLAVKFLTMVYSTHWLKQNAEYNEDSDTESPNWAEDTPFNEFFEALFPITDHPGFGNDSSSSFWDLQSSIIATKLRKGGLVFKPTEDLSNHLKLNRKTGAIQIFHHTAFLKESLKITKGKPESVSVEAALGLGAIPRQLAIEVLDSIQKIIFPLSDPSAVAMLESLVKDRGFDKDCLRFESSAIRESHEINIRYLYFGARLADINDELKNPSPRGYISRWARRKGAGHANIATIVGVGLALLFGLATLGLGVFQAWVGYQQWQHPIRTN
ncbi:hypothetical protein ABW20_dc0105818 [Dactylellina cionopaga]|nr:hypothetical protein ABW20_dc0105818 [Dactylellina cionopaga]